MNVEYPDFFARFYDKIYHFHRDDVDNAWFQEQISSAGGRVLEVGCGTGRLLINALNSGADIYGIDISPSMIKVLSAKLKDDQKNRIFQGNVIDFSLDLSFNLVIAPFRVFMHLQDKDQQLKALNNVYDHLAGGGRFIFDTFVPDLKHIIKGFDNFIDYEGEYEPGKKLKRTVTTYPDLINQVIKVCFRIDWDEDDGPRSEEWTTPLRFFFRYELEHLVERSKFRKYRILGDYHGNELNSDSKEFIIICQK